MPREPRWTREEDEILRRSIAERMNARQMEGLLPERSAKAVISRARRLRIVLRFDWWTKAEDEIIAANVKTKSARQMMALLPGRSRSAIIARSHRLNPAYAPKKRTPKPPKPPKPPKVLLAEKKQENRKPYTPPTLRASKRALYDMLHKAVENTAAMQRKE